MKRKIFSLLLALCMVCTLLPVTALADGGLTIAVANETELIAALTQAEAVDAINITESFTVSSDCSINYAGDNLNYYSGVVVTVQSGVTLTIGSGGQIGSAWYTYEGDWGTGPMPNGKLINNGTIIVDNGGMIGGNFGDNNDAITVKDGGMVIAGIDNSGTITVEAGGVLASTQGGSIENNGEVTVNEGGALITWMGGSFKNNSSAALTMDGDIIIGGGYWAEEENGSEIEHAWFENSGTVTHTGEANTAKVFVTYNASQNVKDGLKTDFGVGEVYYGAPVYTAGELYDALSGESEIFGRIETARLMDNITVEAGKELGSMDVSLIVPDGVTLTLGKNSNLDAQISVNGGGEIVVSGGATLSTTQGSRIMNDGTIAVNAGGTLIS